MRTLLTISLALALFSAGCGGSHYDSSTEDESWATESTSGTSSPGADAGVDSGVDSGDPVRDRAMALITRSCTPCHRHDAPLEPRATARGVYLETDAEILQLVNAYTVGQTPNGLRAIVAQRADGYELMVGPNGQTPMPPRDSSYAPWTQDEARAVLAWLSATH